MDRRRVGDRVQAVEGVGDVDEAALVADRGDRVRERQAARDLLVEEEADDLALAVVFTSSPGMTTRSRSRAGSTASRAPPKTLWSVTAMPPRPDRLGVVEQILGRDRAVVRPVGVEVEVESDPLAIPRAGRRLAARTARRLRTRRRVDGIELGRDRLEALRLGALAGVEAASAPRRGRRQDARPRARPLTDPSTGRPRRPPPRVRVVSPPGAGTKIAAPASAPRSLRSSAWTGRAREGGAGAVSPGESRAASCGAAWPPSRARSRGAGEERVSSRGQRPRARPRRGRASAAAESLRSTPRGMTR